MLNHLHISNFAIVPTLDLEIREGFTAITGETGAGKSILVDALGLLLGDRSDADWVRAGAERAELAAEFSVENNEAARTWLNKSDLSAHGGCLLRRTINANGRSRAYINGTPVTVAQIQSLGRLLVELHGQNEHLRLNKAAQQLKLLDGTGAYTEELERVQKIFSNWQRIAMEMESLDRQASVPESDLDFLKFQLDELQQHDVSVKAVAELQKEHDRLAAGEALLDTLTGSVEGLDPETNADSNGINAELNRILGQLQEFAPLDDNIDDACKMLSEASVNCVEALSALRTARDRVELNPARFEKVSRSLGQLHDMARKHRVSMDGLETVMSNLADRIESAGSSEQRRKELAAELSIELQNYRSAAEALGKRRVEHATRLSNRVTGMMGELGMAGGSFEFVVSPNPQASPSARGDDEVQILVSANPGFPPGPLSKVASGGELSRISLAIKVATTSGGESITQIFDEVDAGIGGDTANAVGRLIKRLSKNRLSGNGQALCVTHLAQVAVCANHQLQVRKASEKDSTMVDSRFLNSTERVDEIARMLSGQISEQSRAHATELLKTANSSSDPG